MGVCNWGQPVQTVCDGRDSASVDLHLCTVWLCTLCCSMGAVEQVGCALYGGVGVRGLQVCPFSEPSMLGKAAISNMPNSLLDSMLSEQVRLLSAGRCCLLYGHEAGARRTSLIPGLLTDNALLQPQNMRLAPVQEEDGEEEDQAAVQNGPSRSVSPERRNRGRSGSQSFAEPDTG